MKKVGEYWVPDIDMRPFRNRRKTLRNYGEGRHGSQIHHLDAALAHLRAYLPEGTLEQSSAIDGGANIGAFARRMAASFREVHAFEPAPDTAACLARNVADWGLGGRLIPHAEAISDSEGLVGMGGGGWFRRSISREVKGEGSIRAVALDSLGLTDLLFLKLDVEGHELRALQGAEQSLARGRAYVMMEMKDRHLAEGGPRTAAHDWLLARGYRIVADLGDPVLDRLYAPPGRD
ncbi:MAG: FkbM family methyltransferase [Proteobacteria bacterium]|nr:FkbM family methyltransferase [Pseudomonadota bacterium]